MLLSFSRALIGRVNQEGVSKPHRFVYAAAAMSSASTTSNSSPFQVVVHKDSKAVVLLFGWLGADIRHVNTYAQIYEQKGCSTVSGVADSVTLLTARKSALRDFALEAASKAAALLRKRPKQTLPLYIHVFSNGGAFVLEQLEVAILERTNDDVALCGERLLLGAEIFDSAPAYVSPSSGMKAVEAAVPNFALRVMAQSALGTFMAFHAISGTLTRQPLRSDEFWLHVNSVTGVASHQVYLYSPHDEITDHVKLEELIEHRKTLGTKVTVQKFAKSGHVQHFWTYPKEYDRVIDTALAGPSS